MPPRPLCVTATRMRPGEAHRAVALPQRKLQARLPRREDAGGSRGGDRPAPDLHRGGQTNQADSGHAWLIVWPLPAWRGGTGSPSAGTEFDGSSRNHRPSVSTESREKTPFFLNPP